MSATATLSPYAIIKQLNGILAELGVEKSLPPQMGYTYAKKGMINGTKGAKKFTQAEADAWIQKYLVKNGYAEAAESVDPNQLALDI